jgi:hypothetical protein
VARYSGIPVEIQIRTRYQQAWAEATERLADSWGRGIRAGRAPVGRTKAEVADRAEALAKWELVAERITRLEREITSLTDELSSRILAALQADPAKKPADVAARLVSEDPTLTEAIKAASAAMSTVLREGGLELASLESAR